MSFHPSYHHLFVTAPGIERTSIFRLAFGLEVSCNRVGGWQLWNTYGQDLVAGEYDGPEKWLILDVAGHEIVNSRDDREEE